MSIVINGYTGEVTSEVNGSNDWTVGVLNVNGDEFEVLMKKYSKKPLVCEESGEFLTTEDLEFHNDLYVRTDGCVLSRQVAIDNYYQCERCRQWERADRGVYTNDDYYFCDDCADEETIQCDDCGAIYSADYFDSHGLSGESEYGSGVNYCDRCSEHYVECENCGRIVLEDYACWDDDGYTYCSSCYQDVLPRRSPYIHDYHYDPRPDYGFEHLDDGDPYANPQLGTELEVEFDDNETRNEAAEDVLGALGINEDKAVLCDDGSLTDGFEIIGAPANLRNTLHVMNWEGAIEEVKRYGGTSHDNGDCGHHIHIDRGYFEDGNMTREEVEAAFLTVLTNNAAWIKNFSRRETWGFCKMNNENPGEADDEKLTDSESIIKLWNKKLVKNKTDRYLALNFRKEDTIELRFFRGTLNYETFTANEQYADMTARLIKSCETLDDVTKIDLNSYKQMATERDYVEFLHYLDRRGIIDGTEDVYREDDNTEE